MNSYKKELVSVRIPNHLNKKFTEYVALRGLSKNAFILNLIYAELAKTKNSTHETFATQESERRG